MALVTPNLAADLKALFDEMDRTEMSNTEYANRLAAILDKQTKTATVTVNGVESGGSTATGTLS